MKSENSDAQTAEALIREMQRFRGSACPSCTRPLCAYEVLMNLALGFPRNPRCLRCLAAALDHEPISFRDHLIGYLHQRECHRRAWEWADQAEGAQPGSVPACLALEADPRTPSAQIKNVGEKQTSPPPHEEAVWNAGDLGCGELVLELRLRLQAMQPGQIMKLCAQDPGAPEDLPAWCRLTGHTLLRAEHPNYWIKRKE